MIRINNAASFKNVLKIILDNRLFTYEEIYKSRVKPKKNGLRIPNEDRRFYYTYKSLKNRLKHTQKRIFNHVLKHPFLNHILFDEDKQKGISIFLGENRGGYSFEVLNAQSNQICKCVIPSEFFDPHTFLDVNKIYFKILSFNSEYFSEFTKKLNLETYHHKYSQKMKEAILSKAKMLNDIDYLFFLNNHRSVYYRTPHYKHIEELEKFPMDFEVPAFAIDQPYSLLSDSINRFDYNFDFYDIVFANYRKPLSYMGIANRDDFSSFVSVARQIKKMLIKSDIRSDLMFFHTDHVGLYLAVFHKNDMSKIFFNIKITPDIDLKTLNEQPLYRFQSIQSALKKIGNLMLSKDTISLTDYTLGQYVDDYQELITLEQLKEY